MQTTMLLSTALNNELCAALSYNFGDQRLLDQALSHRSMGGPRHTNERLELLGDSVLGLVITQHCLDKLPNSPEGQLVNLKRLYCNNQYLSGVAIRLTLDCHLRLSRAAENQGTRGNYKVLADCLEAVIGAIYLDGGLGAASKFIHRHILAS